jgi:BASS family bile acid:Na+ symporter
VTGVELTIQVLTCCALIGLLGAVGLRLTYDEVKGALAQCRFLAILLVNFTIVPALAISAALAFGLQREIAIGMILLAAAPFAPVVPVFARMARAELALAAALTGVFPLLSVLFTPIAARAAFWMIGAGTEIRFNMWTSFATLVATITFPLALGVLIRHWAPSLAHRLRKPVEVISEATGAVSLAFVSVTQFGSIMNLGWRAWLAMALVSEISLAIGWQMGGPRRRNKQVVAFGTSNRNIALALLIAIQSFHGTAIASVVVGNGLLLIAFGLLHVAWWRFVRPNGYSA